MASTSQCSSQREKLPKPPVPPKPAFITTTPRCTSRPPLIEVQPVDNAPSRCTSAPQGSFFSQTLNKLHRSPCQNKEPDFLNELRAVLKEPPHIANQQEGDDEKVTNVTQENADSQKLFLRELKPAVYEGNAHSSEDGETLNKSNLKSERISEINGHGASCDVDVNGNESVSQRAFIEDINSVPLDVVGRSTFYVEQAPRPKSPTPSCNSTSSGSIGTSRRRSSATKTKCSSSWYDDDDYSAGNAADTDTSEREANSTVVDSDEESRKKGILSLISGKGKRKSRGSRTSITQFYVDGNTLSSSEDTNNLKLESPPKESHLNLVSSSTLEQVASDSSLSSEVNNNAPQEFLSQSNEILVQADSSNSNAELSKNNQNRSEKVPPVIPPKPKILSNHSTSREPPQRPPRVSKSPQIEHSVNNQVSKTSECYDPSQIVQEKVTDVNRLQIADAPCDPIQSNGTAHKQELTAESHTLNNLIQEDKAINSHPLLHQSTTSLPVIESSAAKHANDYASCESSVCASHYNSEFSSTSTLYQDAKDSNDTSASKFGSICSSTSTLFQDAKEPSDSDYSNLYDFGPEVANLSQATSAGTLYFSDEGSSSVPKPQKIPSASLETPDRRLGASKSMSLPIRPAHLTPNENKGEAQSCSMRETATSFANSDGSWGEEGSSSDEEFTTTFEHTKRNRAFHVAQELMTTERTFVDVLRLINQDFREAVVEAKKKRGGSVIPDAALNQILCYLPQLQNLNQELLTDLEARIKNWETRQEVADVIVQKGPFLKLYSSYIRDFESIIFNLEDCLVKYPQFAQVVAEFEASDRCKKLALKHYMLKPVQRIPQYRLLLEEYLRHLPAESSEKNLTETALSIMKEVAEHANRTLKQDDNFSKLLQLQNKIAEHHEVIKPGRVLLKEGELLKLCRKGMQPRYFILLNDVLLYTSVTQQGLYRLHNELPLMGMQVTIPTQEDHQNEFSIISLARSFILSSSSPAERDDWVKVLNTAIEENNRKRETFAACHNSKRSTVHGPCGPVILGRLAPVWIADARVTMCQACTRPFTVTHRRHHCRACGKVVCGSCSTGRAPLEYLKYQSARVCNQCFNSLQKDMESKSGETGDIPPDLGAQFRMLSPKDGRKIWRSIPKVLQEVSASDQSSTIAGYLHKWSKKSWKRRWFLIKDKVLYTYRASEDVVALESLPLLGMQMKVQDEVDNHEDIDSQLLFQLIHPSLPTLTFYAENPTTASRWTQAMRAATVLE